MRHRGLREEHGNVLVTALFLIVGMMMIGLATSSIVDNQTGQSRKERLRESSFNLTEGVLTSQTYVLGRLGTGTAAKPFPNKCAPSSSEDLCPHAAELSASFSGSTQADFAAGSNWETAVRDDQDPNNAVSDYYHPSLTDSDCNASPIDYIWCYDQNANDQLWVRASSTVRGKTRTIVALIKVEKRQINFPKYAILAGGFATSNNGNKVIVDATGSLGIGVRCTQTPPSSGNPCLGYNPGKGQLTPAGAYVTGLAQQPAITEDDLVALEDAAKAAGTWYSSCPSNPNGLIVYVKSGDCSYTNSAPAAQGASKCCNTATNPGLFVIENGTFQIGGNIEFFGIVYGVNRQNSTGPVVTTQGTSLIKGGVMVDGDGKVQAGSSGMNIDYVATPFENVRAAGTAGVVQNTWREVPAD
jgi:hypothetical protein